MFDPFKEQAPAEFVRKSLSNESNHGKEGRGSGQPLAVICAWCNDVITETMAEPTIQFRHGMCDQCAAELSAALN